VLTQTIDPPRQQAPGSLRHRLRLPALITVVVQTVLVLGDRVPSIDTLSYLESGRSLLSGDGYVRQGAPEVHFPPGIPVGLGLLHGVMGDELRAVQVWNLGWGLALVAVMVALAWRISHDDDVTVATAWLATTVGGGVCLAIRGGGGSEVPTAVLTLTAALLALRLVAPDPGGAAPRPVLGGAGIGALLGLAYLMRPEALLWGVLLVGAVAWHLWRAPGRTRNSLGSAAKALTAVALVAAAMCGPYVVRQHDQTGSWTMTAKAKDASLDSWRAIAEGDRLQRDRSLYVIDDDGVTLGAPTQPLTTLARQDPVGWLSIVGVNAINLVKLYAVWQLVPIFLLAPALHRLWSKRRQPETQILVAVAVGPVITCLAFFTLPRYLLLTTAVLVPYGVWGLTDWIRGRSRRRARWAWRGVVVGSLLSLVVAAWPLLPGSPSAEPTEQRAAGEWIDRNLPADARILTRSYQVQHYAQREVVALPMGTTTEVIEFARRRGATHLVADETSMRSRRPDLVDDLLTSTAAPPGLTLEHEVTRDGNVARIYRLTPPPERSPLGPLPLGYVSD